MPGLQWVTQTGVGARAEKKFFKNSSTKGGYLLHIVAIGNVTHMLMSTMLPLPIIIRDSVFSNFVEFQITM